LGNPFYDLNNGLQGSALFPQRLCPFRAIPDIRRLQFTTNFYQALFLGIEVKDTSVKMQLVPADL
jgi:hypothetical protein